MEFTYDLGGNLATNAREDLEALKGLKGGLDEAGAALGRYADKAGAVPASVAPTKTAAPAAAKRGPGRPPTDPAIAAARTELAAAKAVAKAEKAAAKQAIAEAKAEAKAEKLAAKAAAPQKAPKMPDLSPEDKYRQKMKDDALAGGLKGNQSATEAYYAKVRALEAGAGKASDAAREKKSAGEKVSAAGTMSLAKQVALAGGAALGVAGAGGLAKLALGYRGVMQLQGVSYRLGLSFRSLFSGINPAPVIRAATMFADQFKKTSVMGHALEGLFTRAFGGIFAAIEKATPYAIAFTQGIVLGFLYAENAVLRARLAFAPYSAALEHAIGVGDGMKISAELGVIALGSLAAAAVVAAAPFLVYAVAIGAVVSALDNLNKIQKEWDENSSSQIWAKVKQDLGGAKATPKGLVTGADYDKLHANDAKPAPKAVAASMETGKQIAAGVAKGMDAGAADVAAAGGRIAEAADAGIRTKAKIKSPSRMTEDTAKYLGDGAIRGLEKSGAGVQAAAEKNLVPDVAGMGSSGGRGGAGGAGLVLNITSPLVVVNLARGQDADASIMSAAPRLLDELARLLSLQLGVPIR